MVENHESLLNVHEEGAVEQQVNKEKAVDDVAQKELGHVVREGPVLNANHYAQGDTEDIVYHPEEHDHPPPPSEGRVGVTVLLEACHWYGVLGGTEHFIRLVVLLGLLFCRLLHLGNVGFFALGLNDPLEVLGGEEQDLTKRLGLDKVLAHVLYEEAGFGKSVKSLQLPLHISALHYLHLSSGYEDRAFELLPRPKDLVVGAVYVALDAVNEGVEQGVVGLSKYRKGFEKVTGHVVCDLLLEGLGKLVEELLLVGPLEEIPLVVIKTCYSILKGGGQPPVNHEHLQ
mmetsp:Transcript_6891/g.13719  ORF Transcript_6891/g.13719 Transcript_6891/m.13719 type:complete len:286 (+) Transcript_6891:5271-6128(+)